MKKKIAIVGSGISAMGSAYYLRDDFDITIFEKNDYLGGHTHTHRLEEDGHKFTVDSGFIVFNLRTYPNLVKLFDELGVKKQKCSMSFGVWNMNTNLQYSSNSFLNLFAQTKNFVSPRYWKFLYEITQFFKVALKDREAIESSKLTIREYCRSNGLSDYFIDNYLAPMSSAVWSTEQGSVYDFPISIIIPFFYNHGLLSVKHQVQWYSVVGGSDDYTKKIAKAGNFDVHLQEPVQEVYVSGEAVKLKTNKGEYDFDYVVMASHSDESLRIVKNMPEVTRDLLSSFGYNANTAVLHTDESIMQPTRKAWSAWNHFIQKGEDGSAKSSTVYWMNPLQHTDAKKNYFVSINPFLPINPAKIIKEMHYHHPNFTVQNFALQTKLQEINHDTRILFAGAYFGYGFHEDGLKSGLKVVEILKKLK
jgi:predicted NAD/FAD-binding protein